MEIKLEPMTVEDLPEVLAIENRCFVAPWTRSFFVQEVISEFSYPWVARAARTNGNADRGELLGYACVWIVLDEMHIQNLAVHPDSRRRGIGTRLLERVVAFGREKGAKMAVLEVRRSNHEALAIYRKFGFEVVGVRKNYYVEEREDALVMLSVIEEWDLPEGLRALDGQRSE